MQQYNQRKVVHFRRFVNIPLNNAMDFKLNFRRRCIFSTEVYVCCLTIMPLKNI